MSTRVIRVRRGAGAGVVSPPRPRPKIEIVNDYGSRSRGSERATNEVTRFLGSAEVTDPLRSNDYTQIHIHSTHGNNRPHITPSKFSGTLHIYNWSWPTGVAGVSGHVSSATLDKFGTSIEYAGGQRDAHLVAGKLPKGFHHIMDLNGQLLAVGSRSQIYISFDLFHANGGQLETIRYIMRRWLTELEMSTAWLRAYSDDPSLTFAYQTEEVNALFLKTFKKAAGSEVARSIAVRAEADMERAFSNYRAVAASKAALVRSMRGKEMMKGEGIAEVAAAMIKRVEDNPLLSGVTVLGSTVRIATVPLLCRRWHGARRMLISFDIDYTRTNRVRMNGIGPRGEITGLGDTVGSDGQRCLGDVYSYVDKNIISGDWDMAANLVIRATLGAERMKSEVARMGASKRARAKEAAAAEGEPNNGPEPEPVEAEPSE